MFTKKMRSLVICLFMLVMGWTLYEQVYEMSAVMGAGICLLIWGYFREGAIVMAARAFHAKDYVRTEELLKESSSPQYLGKNRRGFYEFMYGSIELNRQNFDRAEYHFQVASNFPLRNANDKAVVLAHLANINLRKQNHERASAYLEKTKGLKVSSKMQQVIDKIALQLR